MSLLDDLGKGDVIRMWFFRKAVGMGPFDLCFRHEYVGRDICTDAFDWIYQKAFESRDLVPLLFTDGKSGRKHRRKELLNILARQPDEFLRQYDLGDLADPLRELRELIAGISDPVEVTRVCESKLGLGEFASPRYAPPPDLTAEEVASYQQMAEADEKVSYESALAVLCRRSAAIHELNHWLDDRLDRVAPNAGSWARVIAGQARDFDLARKALERLLQVPDGRILHSEISRFCGDRGPWKLPPEEGVALIRRAIAVKLQDPVWEENDRGELWLLMIRAYGDHIQDFTDLLLQVENGGLEYSKAKRVIEGLWALGRHRKEVREMVERRFTPPYQSEIASRNRVKDLSLLKTVESPIAWELWMRAAEEWPNDAGRIESTNLLASQDATNPEFIALLQQVVQSGGDYLSGHASRLLEIYSPSDFRAGLSHLPETSGAVVNPLPSSEGFDAEGFRRWVINADQRRLQWMSIVSEGTERWGQIKSSHSLAYWFGDHPETLPCLMDRVRRPTTPSSRDEEAVFLTERKSDDEHDVRQHCFKLLACRWPADERIHDLAKWAIDHPWRSVRDEAARFLARDHGAAPDTAELLERHLGDSDVVFEEYVALKHGDPEAMWKALDALGALRDGDCSYLLCYGPSLLVRAYGPRKDLKEELERLAERTPSKGLQRAIQQLFKELW